MTIRMDFLIATHNLKNAMNSRGFYRPWASAFSLRRRRALRSPMWRRQAKPLRKTPISRRNPDAGRAVCPALQMIPGLRWMRWAARPACILRAMRASMEMIKKNNALFAEKPPGCSGTTAHGALCQQRVLCVPGWEAIDRAWRL